MFKSSGVEYVSKVDTIFDTLDAKSLVQKYQLLYFLVLLYVVEMVVVLLFGNNLSFMVLLLLLLLLSKCCECSLTTPVVKTLDNGGQSVATSSGSFHWRLWYSFVTVANLVNDAKE